MARPYILALALAALLSAPALADPITGDWRTEGGETARIVPCGDEYCITLTTGDYAGRQIGQVAPAGENRYRGSITDPSEDRTYSGRAELTGDTLRLSGCVLGGLICRGENWVRQ
jgi:uncharacterized protein (DUF2147 family)